MTKSNFNKIGHDTSMHTNSYYTIVPLEMHMNSWSQVFEFDAFFRQSFFLCTYVLCMPLSPVLCCVLF